MNPGWMRSLNKKKTPCLLKLGFCSAFMYSIILVGNIIQVVLFVMNLSPNQSFCSVPHLLQGKCVMPFAFIGQDSRKPKIQNNYACLMKNAKKRGKKRKKTRKTSRKKTAENIAKKTRKNAEKRLKKRYLISASAC